MPALICDDQPADAVFSEMIAHAALAGSCGEWMRREPQAARGLARVRDKHSALAGRLLGDMMGGQTPFPKGLTALAPENSGGRSFPDAN